MNIRSICLLSNLISSHVVLTPPNTVSPNKHDKDKFKDAAAPGVLVPLGRIAKVRFCVMADLSKRKGLKYYLTVRRSIHHRVRAASHYVDLEQQLACIPPKVHRDEACNVQFTRICHP